MPLITKAKSIEAQTQLKAVFNSEQQYYFMNSKYSASLEELDFERPKTVKENGSANYNYEIIQASSGGFKARATAVVDFNGNGTFNVWEINQNGNPIQITKD
ncbi:type IV pilin protein [Flavobacterium pallidum]|nr:hypothetical protein [Flavobacterium pallidum]